MEFFGHIAAIELGEDQSPIIHSENDFCHSLLCGTDFNLPISAVPPMEAIYNDGTPEGYLEAVLCSLFLSAVPYARFESEHWDIIMAAPPANIDKDWNTLVNIPDWRPRAVIEKRSGKILAFRREIENGFGSSSGCDRIYLTQYAFYDKLALHHMLSDKSGRSTYHGSIDNDKRYTEKRHCCVFSDSSFLISEKKQSDKQL